MRIGIDIDDTITDSWKFLIPHFTELYDIPESELAKSLPYYRSVENLVTKEEYFRNLRELADKLMLEVPLKPKAFEYLTKLHDEGHKLIFITARGIEYDNPYRITKNYLKKMHIPYDIIIVSAHDKSISCREEQIDLFIDDSLIHCQEVADAGFKTILFENSYNMHDQTFPHVKSWEEAYNYINEVKHEKINSNHWNSWWRLYRI